MSVYEKATAREEKFARTRLTGLSHLADCPFGGGRGAGPQTPEQPVFNLTEEKGRPGCVGSRDLVVGQGDEA